MNLSADDLFLIIGMKEAELIVLRQRLAKLEEAVKAKIEDEDANNLP